MKERERQFDDWYFRDLGVPGLEEEGKEQLRGTWDYSASRFGYEWKEMRGNLKRAVKNIFRSKRGK